MYWCIHSAFCHKLLKCTAAKHGGTLSPQKKNLKTSCFGLNHLFPVLSVMRRWINHHLNNKHSQITLPEALELLYSKIAQICKETESQ